MIQKRITVEICCGSYYDAVEAYHGGASRIELNSALRIGGITPTTATLRLVKQTCPNLQVIAMVRPRGGGFCYHASDFAVMQEECRELLKSGADGIAFGCLQQNAEIDKEKTSTLIEIIKEANAQVVLHRAVDC